MDYAWGNINASLKINNFNSSIRSVRCCF